MLLHHLKRFLVLSLDKAIHELSNVWLLVDERPEPIVEEQL